MSKRKNKYGCYGIKLYLNGEPTEVVIDDLLPYDYSPETDSWAFSHCKSTNEVYILLLEKAFAKAYGSYEAIESDTVQHVLQMLTGFPCDTLSSRRVSLRDLWDCIS